jgi:hypothetical protein
VKHVSLSFWLPPIPPVIAILVMPFLPFINSPGLWFGLPKMMVWVGMWLLLVTPSLIWAEHLMDRRGEGESR